MHEYTKLLFEYADEAYKSFAQKLNPDTKYEIIGVKMPRVKEILKKSVNDPAKAKDFLTEKHRFLEEWLLHGLILSKVKDVSLLLSEIERFLPYIDGWAICDCFCAALKAVTKNKQIFFNKIKEWIRSPAPYTVRVAVVLLLDYFCEQEYFEEIFSLTQGIKCKHYYVDMAVAWLYSVLLVKNYFDTVKFFETSVFDKFVHNKALQKAIESFRIDDKRKKYLKTLKIK